MSIKESIKRHRNEVQELRHCFLTERYAKQPELYDECDIQKLRSTDWPVWRFLRTERYNAETALEKLDRCLRWRRESDINYKRGEDVPKEFYEIGGMFTYNEDRDGTCVIYMRIKVNLKIARLNRYIKDFMTFVIDRVDQRTNESGFVVLIDLTDAGLRNADLDLCSHLIHVLRFYFPEALKHCIVYNLPWILRSFWPVVRMWIPNRHQHLVRFANKDEIQDYIDSEQLPKYLGGRCKRRFAEPPDGCRSVREISDNWGFTGDEIDGYLQIFEPHINETQRIQCLD
ncbi:motile sperm domain-containing protein 2-like [Oppia nitens]|uniref:motile sperm domain-containing protein 2-like n=1 Tax=Oppia nitens TaxID=1686743 RepID=UPI0023DCC139|nr:motile sperm domain-containing protein 2-like [Oppia nitens]